MIPFRRCLILFVALFWVGGMYSDVFAQQRKPVTVPGKTFLPLRVLARPFSHIYKKPDGEILVEDVPVFQSYFVYTRPDVSTTSTTTKGWYEVGSDVRGKVLGWMKAEDVMEWKQTLCLSYTHPGGRKPVLMFEKLEPLRELLKSPEDQRKQAAEKYYQDIESGNISKDFPVISKEPNDYIDIVEQFYLLPILEYAPFEIDGIEGRLLKVAAATKSERGGGNLKNLIGTSETEVVAAKKSGGGNQQNPEESSQSLEEPSQSPETIQTHPESIPSNSEVVRKVQMDIVYVVDMTSSMDPYIQATLETIKNMTLTITQNAEVAKSVKFGLWGYRDSLEIPDIEFVTKNFTPELQQVSDFVNTLAGVHAKSGGDYPEDVFSGVDGAMRQTKWTEDALHMLILIGDAPSHEPGHKWNQSGQSADTLRTFASDNGFYIFALHIKDQRAKAFWDLAERQFQTLSKNPGLQGESSYWSVDSKDKAGFDKASQEIASKLVYIIEQAKEGKIVDVASTTSTGKSEKPSQKEDVGAKVLKMGYAALVQWLGREKGTKAPPDITAWITDKDLMDPNIPSLEVRVLVTKNELDSLKTVLQEIMTAGRAGMIGGQDFFKALQAVPSVAARAGDQIRNAKTLAESGLLPEFMLDLPYRSRIMEMSNELWASWSPDQQEEFLHEIDAKIKLYAAIHDNPKGWIALNPGDDPSEYVHPISLEALP
ncbi:MAG TPA: vWA domain-containing protein [Candidatus Limnocylindrales bacterium]|nr:vWA domain-containing protein [Candidatus Limnocylindrales bacterium]